MKYFPWTVADISSTNVLERAVGDLFLQLLMLLILFVVFIHIVVQAIPFEMSANPKDGRKRRFWFIIVGLVLVVTSVLYVWFAQNLFSRNLYGFYWSNMWWRLILVFVIYIAQLGFRVLSPKWKTIL